MAWTVAVGVDTDKEMHVAVALDRVGSERSALTVPASAAGYARLLSWARTLGEPAFALEGAASYGAGLAQVLVAAGLPVYDVERPKRQERRQGKSDLLDANLAARRLVNGEGLSELRGSGERREQLRLLLAERRSAIHVEVTAIVGVRVAEPHDAIVVEPIRLDSGDVLMFQSPLVSAFYLLKAKTLRDDAEPKRVEALTKTQRDSDGNLRPLNPARASTLWKICLCVILSPAAIEARERCNRFGYAESKAPMDSSAGSSEAFADTLLADHGVAVVAGSAFGSGEGFLPIALCGETGRLVAGIERLTAAVE